MNTFPFARSLIFIPAVLLASCGLQQDVGEFSSLGFDPLIAPGTRKVVKPADTSPDAITVGSYVEVAMPNTNFFSSVPNTKSKPASVLAQGAALQIIEEVKGFYRVRQVENGKEGYVVRKTVTHQTTLPDIEGVDPTMLAALSDGIKPVDLSLPSAEDAVIDPSLLTPNEATVPDDGISGGALVEENPSSDGVLVEDVIGDKVEGIIPDDSNGGSGMVKDTVNGASGISKDTASGGGGIVNDAASSGGSGLQKDGATTEP